MTHRRTVVWTYHGGRAFTARLLNGEGKPFGPVVRASSIQDAATLVLVAHGLPTEPDPELIDSRRLDSHLFTAANLIPPNDPTEV